MFSLILATMLISTIKARRRPVARDDSFTVQEVGISFLDVLDNDSDPNGDPILVNSLGSTSPIYGTVTIAPGRTGLEYEIVGDPCSDNGLPATLSDTLNYDIRDNTGRTSKSFAMVSITIDCLGTMDRIPAASPQPATAPSPVSPPSPPTPAPAFTDNANPSLLEFTKKDLLIMVLLLANFLMVIYICVCTGFGCIKRRHKQDLKGMPVIMDGTEEEEQQALNE